MAKKLFSDATMIWEKYKSQLLQPEIALFANSSSDWANSLLPNFHIQISDWKRSDPRKVDKTELRLNKVDKSEMREGGREVEEEGRVFGGCLVGIYGPS